MTVCNQNRVDCEKLEAIKSACDRIYRNENRTSEAFTSNMTTGLQINENNFNVTIKTNKNVTKSFLNEDDVQDEVETDMPDIDRNSPEYTICQKMSVSGDKTLIEYLFDEGKCGKICREGNIE